MDLTTATTTISHVLQKRSRYDYWQATASCKKIANCSIRANGQDSDTQSDAGVSMQEETYKVQPAKLANLRRTNLQGDKQEQESEAPDEETDRESTKKKTKITMQETTKQ